MVDVVKVGEQLDSYANHFVHRDWKVEHPHHVVDVVDDRCLGERKLWRNIKNSFHWLNPNDGIVNLLTVGDLSSSDEKVPLKKQLKTIPDRLNMFKHCITHLRDNASVPDVTLDNGCVISFWAETGEYLSLVQPSVGDLVSKFLKEDPTNPHAITIATEIERIITEVNEWEDGKECY